MKAKKRGSVRKTLEEMKRFFCKTGNLWFFIIAFMLDLATRVITDG